jgi:sarcosine reductase
MSLEIQKQLVNQLMPSDQTRMAAGQLVVDADDLRGQLKRLDSQISRVLVDVVNPGDSTRILCVKDVVEPRLQISGTQSDEGVVRVLGNAEPA